MFEYGIEHMGVLYPGGTKCTQSMGSLYVTIQGDIRGCVGTHFSYGSYEPGNNMLRNAIEHRREKEKVGFGCVPRLLDSITRGLDIPEPVREVYQDGMR